MKNGEKLKRKGIGCVYAGQGEMCAGGDRLRSTYHWRRNDLYFGGGGGLIQFHVQYNNFIVMYMTG